jgi:ribosomal protein L11 methyltransferase
MSGRQRSALLPRRWLELAARGPDGDERAPLLAEGLLALGGRAVEERDAWFVTHVPAPEDAESYVEEARARLVAVSGMPHVQLLVREIPEEDWAESWKRGLGPRRITSRLVVTPTWHPVEAGPDELVVVLDPGMAFGTAEHGTTRGCLRLLDQAVTRGARILDVGAGSGILAIAAARMGAAEVAAVEGDGLAQDVIHENVERNGVEGVVRCHPVWADATSLASLGPCDGVVANIESRTLVTLLPGFRSALKPAGWLILSGILDVEWDEVKASAEGAGFGLKALDEDGEWRSAWFVRAS